MKGLIVTGTDTGCGKTIITCAIILYMRRAGIDCIGLKPVETGFDGDSAGDSSFIARISGMDDRVSANLYIFRSPLAPLLSARFEGKVIQPHKLVEFIKSKGERHEFIVVEGIGGIMVPLTEDYPFIELMKEVDLPSLIVAKNRLGAINHTLLSLRMAEREGAKIKGVILNNTDSSSDLAKETNPSLLKELLKEKFLGEFPYLTDLSDEGLFTAISILIHRII